MDIQCALVVGGVSIVLVALGYGYKIKMDKKSMKLEKNDQIHDKKHRHNETRIKTLEDKNGNEQRQIDEQRKEINNLKDQVIKLQEKIIRDGKNS